MKPEDEIRRLVDAVCNREEIDWDESEKASESSKERAFIQSLRILRGIADHGAPLSRIELAPGRPPFPCDNWRSDPDSSEFHI